MTCEEFGARLAGYLYGECSGAERSAIHEHLSDCPSCRGRLEELEEGRRALDVLEGDGATVDLGRLYRGAAHRSEQRARLWKLAGAAAVLLCVLSGALAVLSTEIEWRPDGLTIRWGRSSRPEEASGPRRGVEAEFDARFARLEVLEDLVRVAVTEMEAARQSQQRRLAQVERRLLAVERRSTERLQQLDEDVRAIYLTQFAGSGERETGKER